MKRTHISLDKNSNTEFYTDDILSSLNSILQIYIVILTNFTLFKLKKFTSSFGFVALFLSSVKYDQAGAVPTYLQQISLWLTGKV